jgi:hypothetical protein
MLAGYYRTSGLSAAPRQALKLKGIPEESIFTDLRRHTSVELYRAVGTLDVGDALVLHSVTDIGPLHGDIERFIEWVARRRVDVRVGNYLFDLTDHIGVLMFRTLVTVSQFEHATRASAA